MNMVLDTRMGMDMNKDMNMDVNLDMDLDMEMDLDMDLMQTQTLACSCTCAKSNASNFFVAYASMLRVAKNTRGGIHRGKVWDQWSRT